VNRGQCRVSAGKGESMEVKGNHEDVGGEAYIRARGTQGIS